MPLSRKPTELHAVMPVQDFSLPKFYILLVVVLTIWPTVLMFFDLNLSASQHITPQDIISLIGLPDSKFEMAIFNFMSGPHLHGLLEWTSVIIAVLAAILALMHYSISRDMTSPIIGITLLCCGVMDGFHAFAAFYWVEAAAGPQSFIPFTWALARGFSAVIFLLGAIVCLNFERIFARVGNHIFFIVTALAAAVAYSLIYMSTLSPELPAMQFPGAFITRPYDVAPLIVYIVAMPIFWRFYKARPSYLTAALLLALIPYIALEIHMAFGSSELFDAHFNVAHGLKVLAYLIPFIGLLLDFARAFQNEKITIQSLHDNEVKLVSTMNELTKSNADLQHFAYSASHDLKSPLRAIHSLSGWLAEDLEGKVDEETLNQISLLQGRASRMEDLLKSMMAYTRTDDPEKHSVTGNAYKIASVAIDMLGAPQGFDIVIDEKLKSMTIRNPQINQVFLNLVGNAIKHHNNSTGTIRISGQDGEDFHQFTVEDDGPGIAEDYHERIFGMFQTLRRKDEVEGSGMGLALVRKIILKSGGNIDLESEVGKGSRFIFTWPAG